MDKEHRLFDELSSLDLGPKWYAYEPRNYRIEEFILTGEHPTIEGTRDKVFRYLLAIYLGKFHKINLEEKFPKCQPVLDKKLNDLKFIE